MKVLVTGGGGFLGGAIIDELLKRGDEVSNLSRHKYPDLEARGVDCFTVDIRNKEAVNLLDFSSYDCIFHVAAMAGIWGRKSDFFEINIKGTQNIYEKAHACGVKYFIYTSSPSAIFGNEDIKGGDENLPYPTQFSSYYGESKALAEQYILEACKLENAPKMIALRPHLIWGPRRSTYLSSDYSKS